VPTVLQIDGLRKRYGALTALDGISFDVRQGERLALLGPNGAGKTTLVRCICGLIRPDSGSIRLLGRVLPRSGGRQALGLVPQELALYGELSAKENLEVFGRFHGLRGRVLRQRVRWALEWTGLEDRASQAVGSFSGGMKRRVNIACGVLHQPRVVMLDEPTVGVDPQSRERIYQMLDRLAGEGTALVWTTHHLDEAESGCDRIVIVDHGRVVAEGTLANLVQQTVGSSRQVRLQVEQPYQADVEGWDWDEPSSAFLTRIDDVAGQLPQMLQRVRKAGYHVADVEVHAPRLHHVFLHLTGHQLRE
jgi:ABC-2 type transport system ATP-binding protein